MVLLQSSERSQLIVAERVRRRTGWSATVCAKRRAAAKSRNASSRSVRHHLHCSSQACTAAKVGAAGHWRRITRTARHGCRKTGSSRHGRRVVCSSRHRRRVRRRSYTRVASGNLSSKAGAASGLLSSKRKLLLVVRLPCGRREPTGRYEESCCAW